MLRLLLSAPILALGLIAATAGAHDHAVTVGDITVEQAKARPTIPNRPAAVYLTIRNAGETDDRLISASSSAFETTELHLSEMQDGVMSMRAVEDILLPAGGMVMLQPGGLHLMLFGGAGPLEDGAMFPVTLTFANAGEATVMVSVGPIDGASGHGHGHGSSGDGVSGHGTSD